MPKSLKPENDLNKWYIIAWITTIILVLVAVALLYHSHMVLEAVKGLMDHIHEMHL